MPFNSSFRDNPNSVEYGKFVQLSGDNRFPAVSVIRSYPRGTGLTPVTAMDVYQKYAGLVYVVNQGQPSSTNWDIAAANATTGSFTAYGDIKAVGATIYNFSGVTIDIKRTNGSANFISLSTGNTLQIPISGNLSEISVRSSAGTVSVPCMYTV
jgi:hypothetical protein